ncbi:DNA-directed DNA polymerase alpha subunit pol12 [Orbilia brochopaga]|uniref:DNA polymerase alpha subunit B n=1 Tax=Orbilia brochopaga TaxID=3140254 RepID=A0AAV9UYP7_9PEZI
MADAEELADKFGDLPEDIMVELQSMLRLYTIDADELFIKWEAYCIKMGEDVKMDLKNVFAFKKDVQQEFEAEMRSKARPGPSSASRPAPRAVKNPGDMFNMLDGLVPNTPKSAPGTAKRRFDKASYETPLAERTSKLAVGSSPAGPHSSFQLPNSPATTLIPFRNRLEPGKVMEVLNPQIAIPPLPLPGVESWESRVELTVQIDREKFGYKTMFQKLTQVSQYLDDRINNYADLIQQEHNIPDDDFCNPNSILPEEVVVVGRIVSDAIDSQKRSNEASLLLESSRGRGEGRRTPLDLSNLKGYSFFPGMLVAFRATNPTGKKLIVKSIISPPKYPAAASVVPLLERERDRLAQGNMNVFIAAGPYTTDDNLDFEALVELVDKIEETSPDVVFLNGPFIDADHSKVKFGDFELDNAAAQGSPLDELFKQKISSQLKRITKSLVIIVPSTRDAVSKHIAFPQDVLPRKQLGLPANVKMLTNPCVISINEVVFGISSADILFHLSMEEVKSAGKGIEVNTFHRVADHVITQNNFYPLFPPPSKTQVGYVTPIDVVWLELAEFPVKPDVLILPSNLPGTVKVVSGAVTINPGFLSTKRASGTYAFMTVEPPTEILAGNHDPNAQLKHQVYHRARVEIRRI